LYEDLKNYDDTKFLPYYELYYTGIIVAEYWTIQREIVQLETIMANDYAEKVISGEFPLTVNEECLANLDLESCREEFS